MPIIYLSPSTQEWNTTYNGGTEEYYMNLLADALEPYLLSSGIRYVRNTPDMTAASVIAASNAGKYDLHLALHSNAAPEGESGKRRGIEVYYAQGSTWGKKAAEIIAKNLASIYPVPENVRALPTTSLGEVMKTYAPAVLVELGYHDNAYDFGWLEQNIEKIAENLAISLTEYFGIPFVWPQPPKIGYVSTQGGVLNVRSRPNLSAQVLGQVANGTPLLIYGWWNGWYVVEAGDLSGYVSSRYVRS